MGRLIELEARAIVRTNQGHRSVPTVGYVFAVPRFARARPTVGGSFGTAFPRGFVGSGWLRLNSSPMGNDAKKLRGGLTRNAS